MCFNKKNQICFNKGWEWIYWTEVIAVMQVSKKNDSLLYIWYQSSLYRHCERNKPQNKWVVQLVLTKIIEAGKLIVPIVIRYIWEEVLLRVSPKTLLCTFSFPSLLPSLFTARKTTLDWRVWNSCSAQRPPTRPARTSPRQPEDIKNGLSVSQAVRTWSVVIGGVMEVTSVLPLLWQDPLVSSSGAHSVA